MRYFLFFIFVFSTTIVSGQRYEVAIDESILESLKAEEYVPILVVMKEQADLSMIRKELPKEDKAQAVYKALTRVAEDSQRDLKSYLNKENIDYKTYYIVNMIHLYANDNIIKVLSSRSDVASIISDNEMDMLIPERGMEVNNRESTPEWGILKIKADSVWSMGVDGTGVVVGGQDTGYDWDVSPLKEKYRGWSDDTVNHNYSWHDAIREINPMHGDETLDPSSNPCGLDTDEPCDDHNHGTHTMGTMVGSDSINQIGVAPGAKWIGCRNMERGYGSPSSYIECFEWFLAPTNLDGENPNPSMAPHVINNSWGCPPVEGCNESNFYLVESAVEALRASGVVVVVSAGNSGPSCGTIDNPAAMFEGSFTVGNTTITDTLARSSSRGVVTVDSSLRLKPNVSAPGTNVRSVIRGGVYRSYSGTSMAGPHVAGTVALMISANPELAGRVDIIEDILEQTAIPLSGGVNDCNDVPAEAIPNTGHGYGRIDALKAVQRAMDYVTDTNDIYINNRVNVYPNPNNGTFTISADEDISMIRLYSLEGRLLKELSVSGISITVEIASPQPIMIYEVITETGKYNGKIISRI